MAIINTKRQYYQGKLVSYMKKNEAVLRFKLTKIERKYLNPNLRVKPTYQRENPKELNKAIDELEEKIDTAVSQILYDDPKAKITSKVIKEFLHSQTIREMDDNNNEDVADKHILLYDFECYINKFKEEKRKEDVAFGITRKLHPSVKDYISAKNAIDDYEHARHIIVHLEEVDDFFIDDFIDFLSDEYPELEDYEYKTKGPHNNKTINKRLSCLATMIRRIYDDDKRARMITKARLDEESVNDIIRLSLDELKMLAQLELTNDKEIKVRDYFVLLCKTGLRFSDLIEINENNFFNENGVVSLKLFTHKTKKRAIIPIHKKTYKLAKKYHFKFRDYTNQALNRGIKELLQSHHLFEDEIIHSTIRKKKITQQRKMRRECITCHTARRTFISIAVEQGVPLADIMSMTGHKKTTTLQIYIDQFGKDRHKTVPYLNF